jgi:hypothetical protein
MSARPPVTPTADRLAAYATGDPAVNGIDYVEVAPLDPAKPNDKPVVRVTFMRPLPAAGFPSRSQVTIDGGERIAVVPVLATAVDPSDAHTLLVTVDRLGDFSSYRLTVASSVAHPLDPQLSGVDVLFHVDCATRFDCKPPDAPPSAGPADVTINYLAKDYATFRRAMLDRLALVAPNWRERHPADVGVTLVELLAYVADRLSYRQDAIAAEAYLGTARRRVSVRRHAKLVDYAVHEGCNARAWVQFVVGTDQPSLARGTRLYTTLTGRGPAVVEDALLVRQAEIEAAVVFETMAASPALYAAHNVMPLYAWSEPQATLPAGATSAALEGAYPNLAAGTCIVLGELLGRDTGVADDADPALRHPVVLTAAAVGTDPLTHAAVTQIAWGAEDALPFPLTLTRTLQAADGTTAMLRGVSGALGNVVLADNGRTLGDPHPEALGTVPDDGRFRPALGSGPLTWANDSPYDDHARLTGSAAAATATDAAAAYPQLLSVTATGVVIDPLTGIELDATQQWTPYPDLLDATIGADTPAFVVEVEDDGIARLRFGDGVNGTRPLPGYDFTASYRVGNGSAGNVGTDAIAHVAAPLQRLLAVRNVLPARGGVDQESVARVRADAPWAFRTQERAVMLDDYARAAEQHPDVLRAAAALRWTGSWSTVFVAVETRSGQPFDDALRQGVIALLDRYRMAGTDVEVEPARIVPVELGLRVAVDDAHRTEDVRAALYAIFTDRATPAGTPGLFDPNTILMGARLYLSPFVAAARNVPGVAGVDATRFARADLSEDGLSTGYLVAHRTEVFALRNNPDFPERGTFALELDGGR